MNEPVPPPKKWTRWAKWLAPFIGALLVGGVISGASTWNRNRDTEAQLDKLFEKADAAYQQQAQQQAQIDQLYESCSQEWIEKTTDNTVESLQTLFTLRDPAAFAAEGRDLVQKLCVDGDLEAYCKGYAQVLVKWVVGDLGSAADAERGCRKSVGLD